MKIKVDNVECKVIHHFQVSYIGWEMDNNAWIVSYLRKKRLVMTSHGQKYFADKKELEDKIEEYEKLLLTSKHALSLL